MVTRAVCGLVVNNVVGPAGLHQAGRAPGRVAELREEGGPVYQRSGTSNAAALGLIVAFTDSGRNMLGEKLGSFESHLGVTVITA